jgi:hypothetical protein
MSNFQAWKTAMLLMMTLRASLCLVIDRTDFSTKGLLSCLSVTAVKPGVLSFHDPLEEVLVASLFNNSSTETQEAAFDSP